MFVINRLNLFIDEILIIIIQGLKVSLKLSFRKIFYSYFIYKPSSNKFRFQKINGIKNLSCVATEYCRKTTPVETKRKKEKRKIFSGNCMQRNSAPKIGKNNLEKTTKRGKIKMGKRGADLFRN